VGGAAESKPILQSKRSTDALTPSTILRCCAASDDPPPPLARGRMSFFALAMRLHPSYATLLQEEPPFTKAKGGGAPEGAIQP
jgi:hypothetical protein